MRDTNQFLIAFCEYHGLKLGYLYSDRETSEVIDQFESLYKNVLQTHREEIARLTILKTCESLDVTLEEFGNPTKKWGDIGLARQLVCYLLERFGYVNGTIAKTLGFSPPRVTASIITANQRLRDHHIRVAMTVIYSEVFDIIFKKPRHENNTLDSCYSDPDSIQGVRPGAEKLLSPRRNIGQPL